MEDRRKCKSEEGIYDSDIGEPVCTVRSEPAEKTNFVECLCALGNERHSRKKRNKKENSVQSPQTNSRLKVGLSPSSSSAKSSCKNGASFQGPQGNSPRYNQNTPESSKSRLRNQGLPLSKEKMQKSKTPQNALKFEPYIPLFKVQQGLKRGEFIEGALRINPRSYEDAYISAPNGQMDIYIGGMKDRNRALNGDLVAVRVKPKQEWKVLCDAIKDYQEKQSHTLVETVYSPITSSCKIHTPERMSKTPSKSSSTWNEEKSSHRPDSVDFIDVDKLSGQLSDLTTCSKKKSRGKRRSKSTPSSKESPNGDALVETCRPEIPPIELHDRENVSGTSSNHFALWKGDESSRMPDSVEIIGIDKLSDQLVGMPSPQKRTGKSKRGQRGGKKTKKNLPLAKESPNSGASNSQGSSDDFLDRMSSDISPKHDPKTTAEDNSQESSQTKDFNGFHNIGTFIPEVDSMDAPNSHPAGNSSSNWNTEDKSLNIIVSPESLLDFTPDNPIQQLCDQYANDHSSFPPYEELKDTFRNSVVVAPDELSSEEFTDSVSVASSTHLEQIVEDTLFLNVQQDNENNNTGEPILSITNTNESLNRTIHETMPDNLISVDELVDEIQNCNIVEPKKEFNSGIVVPFVGVVLDSGVMVEQRQVYSSASHKQVLTPQSIVLNPQCPEVTLLDSKKDNFSSNEKQRRKRKSKKTKIKSVPKSMLFDGLNIESLTVEEVMRHPLWEMFIQKTGQVVQILERNHSEIAVGHLKLLQNKSLQHALFSPKDSRFPRLMIPMSECPVNFHQRPHDFKKSLFLAKFNEWRENDTFPSGRLIKNLGSEQEIGPQTEGILVEHGVDFGDFPSEALYCLPKSPDWTIPLNELASRQDCRKTCIFTIDPVSARDMDDAISCQLLKNGNYIVGVHIADVTYFVTEHSPLDECAKHRATSVYLVQKVIPMLPRLLCDNLCSLTPGQDRLAFSVFFEITPDAKVLRHWFSRTVINSCIKLSYNHAQDMIENPLKIWQKSEHPELYGGFSIGDVVTCVLQMHELAVKFRKKRFDEGALHLNQVKLQFTLNSETGMPLGFNVYEQKDSNRLIEEFMLLANMTVSKHIYTVFPDCALLRHHPQPTTRLLKEVVNICARMGIHLDASTSATLQASVARYSGQDDLSKAINFVLTHLCSKTMNCASYFCTGVLKDPLFYHHYALNVPYYTHFTSPIRRYPDIIVHRLLAASLSPHTMVPVHPSVIQKQATHCNRKKMDAKRCSEMSDELFLSVFVLKCGPLDVKAMVINVMDHSFDCLVLGYGIVKRVYCDKLSVSDMQYDKSDGVPSLNLCWKSIDSECQQQWQKIIMFSVVDLLLSATEELMLLAKLKNPLNTP